MYRVRISMGQYERFPIPGSSSGHLDELPSRASVHTPSRGKEDRSIRLVRRAIRTCHCVYPTATGISLSTWFLPTRIPFGLRRALTLRCPSPRKSLSRRTPRISATNASSVISVSGPRFRGSRTSEPSPRNTRRQLVEERGFGQERRTPHLHLTALAASRDPKLTLLDEGITSSVSHRSAAPYL